MRYIHDYDSPIGRILLASDGEALVGLWFEGQKHFASTLTEAEQAARPALFDDAVRWLDGYFAGEKPDFTPRINLIGTPFQRSVWARLLEIPYGQTVTYGRLAEALGGASPRAVGGAVARNPISIVVPCHRVVGANGALTGYAGGVDKKLKLLELEKAGITADSPKNRGGSLQ